MPLTKKTVIYLVIPIVLLSSLSGCIFDDIFGGAGFSLVTWSVVDDEDFASINVTFSCSDYITFKILNPSSLLIDTDFFYGSIWKLDSRQIRDRRLWSTFSDGAYRSSV